ncbi:MAG: ASKHA domain-containing protein [Lachnospirales bacterium]
MFEFPFNLELEYDFDEILRIMKVSKDSNAYPIFVKVFEYFNSIQEHIKLTAYVVNAEKTNRLDCLISMNSFLSDMSNKYYTENKYLEALILDELGTQIIFLGADKLYTILKNTVGDNSFLSKRHEEITQVHDIVNNINYKFTTNVKSNEYGMITPIKSLAYFYNVTKKKIDNLDRDCEDCNMKNNCKNRKYNIKIINGNNEINLYLSKDNSLLESIRKNNIHISAPCDGKGTCHNCKVQIASTKEWILACNYKIHKDETIIIKNQPKDSLIESNFYKFESKNKLNKEYGIGIDIGTTTIVFSLVNNLGNEIDSIRVLNPQQAYGSDVVSRIQYARHDESKTLTNIIRNLILKTINNFIDVHRIKNENFDIVLSANTTMLYLLIGLNVEDLAASPFEPCKFIFDEFKLGNFKINIFPWISGFVGGDILSGLYSIPDVLRMPTTLYIDIGTNGEMALIHGGHIYCCSTAAGPAFEGANISSGIGSVAGAINSVSFSKKENTFSVKTINNEKAIGICGSGLIDIIAELIESDIIDQNGYMKDDIQVAENIILTPRDVRQVQLAKASIAGGINTLLNYCNLGFSDIVCLYLCGGFGSLLNIDSAKKIGLISKMPVDKVKILGNTSLSGTIKYMCNNNASENTKLIKKYCKYIELSESSFFNNSYIEEMIFEKY